MRWAEPSLLSLLVLFNVQSTGDDATKHYKSLIEGLVRLYISKERTIIVAAIQCTDDFNNQVSWGDQVSWAFTCHACEPWSLFVRLSAKSNAALEYSANRKQQWMKLPERLVISLLLLIHVCNIASIYWCSKNKLMCLGVDAACVSAVHCLRMLTSPLLACCICLCVTLSE